MDPLDGTRNDILYCRDAVECLVRTSNGARAKGVRRGAVVSQCSGRTEKPSRMECGKVERVKGKVWVGTVQVQYGRTGTHKDVLVYVHN